MMKAQDITKTFDGFRALDGLCLEVKDGSVYGLVGVNGSGKTTIIKHLTGVYVPDTGSVTIDNQPVYNNPAAKKQIGYIPDDLYYFAGYSLDGAAAFYADIYEKWNSERYTTIAKAFGLKRGNRIGRFSKGMQKQAAFALAMATMPRLLILDEPLDGLDPLARKIVLNYIVEDVSERGMSVLISSHNLKELEGICDAVGIIERGRMVVERDLDELKAGICKVQAAFPEHVRASGKLDTVLADMDVLVRNRLGTVEHFIVRKQAETLLRDLSVLEPMFVDLLPLTLEEIFIYEVGNHYETEGLK